MTDKFQLHPVMFGVKLRESRVLETQTSIGGNCQFMKG